MTEKTTLRAELHYRDPDAALAWLEAAFGLKTRLRVADDAGRLVFAEAEFGGQTVAVVPERPGMAVSPKSLGGHGTAMIQVRMADDVDAHCARARAAGAEILAEPETYFFGDLAYLARDLEGHIWNFGQRGAGPAAPPPPGWSVKRA